MGRDDGRRKELQRAEYRNRKDGMETGRTEEERGTVGTADRGVREEGKGKVGRLSSQNRGEAEVIRGSEGKARRRKRKGSTGGTAVGAKPGRMKGNKQEAEYEEPREKTRETGSGGTGKAKEAKAERAHRGSHCEAETGRAERKKQRLSSRKRKVSGGHPASRKRKMPKARA